MGNLHASRWFFILLVPPTKSYDPFLWAAYIVHHSSDNFNLGTAVRNGWFTIFYKPFFYVWIVIIGFRNAVCMGIEALWQFQLHTWKKIGVHREISEYSHHASHHAQNIEYMDKTMVVFLMFLIEFWDLETARWVHYYSIRVSVPRLL
jgi:hypothetical protein